MLRSPGSGWVVYIGTFRGFFLILNNQHLKNSINLVTKRCTLQGKEMHITMLVVVYNEHIEFAMCVGMGLYQALILILC